MEPAPNDLAYRIDERTLRPIPNNPNALVRAAAELQSQAHDVRTSEADRARALGRAGMYLAMLGDLDAAETTLREALDLNRRIGDLRQSVVLWLRQGQVYQWQGRYGEADAVFRDVLSRCQADAGLNDYVSYAFQHAGKSQFDQGHYLDAAACFREALRLREQGDDDDASSSSRLALEVVERRLAALRG